jgi:hypothetical protein
MIETSAPETMAPVLSVTVPVMEPVVCAETESAARITHSNMQTDLEFEIINFESPDFEVMPISIDGRPPEWKSVLLAKNKINHLIPFCCREFQGEAAANKFTKTTQNESIQTAVNPASNSRLLSRKITIG